MKRILSLILILSLSVSLIACTSPDVSLYDAFKNMQEVKAIETNTDISFNLQGEGLGKMEAMQFSQVANIINGMKLNVKGKTVGNKDNTSAKAESEVNIEFMGISMPIKAWTQVDLNTSDMKMIAKIPEMALAMMGNPIEADVENPLTGKEYIIYDIAKMMEEEGQEIDYKEMLDFQKEFQPKLIKIMEDLQKNLKLDSDIIRFEEEKEVEGEKIKVYRLNLNEESLREFTKDLVDYVLENDAIKEFIVDYMNGYIDMMKSMGMTDGLTKEELKDMEEEFENIEEDLDENLKKFKVEFNKFMEKYKDLKILGKDGINVLYSINEDGYIVEEDGVMDFSINLAQIAKLQNPKEGKEKSPLPSPEMKGKINFKINYTTKNTNINNKDLVVTMPETTPENSIDMQELMKTQMEQIDKQMQILEEIDD